MGLVGEEVGFREGVVLEEYYVIDSNEVWGVREVMREIYYFF